MNSLVRVCRPHQYIKNLFVFVGPFFSVPYLLTADVLIRSFMAFVAFCFAASTIYIFNDMMDVEADRAHPTKRNRPLASGALSIRTAGLCAAGLCAAALVLGVASGLWVLVFVVLYLLINLGYCLQWKHIPLVDVFLISAGFMLRILAGTVGLGINPSSWLLLCSFMLTLFLGFSKRRAELLVMEKKESLDLLTVRRVLDQYSASMIEQFTAVSAACTILSYSLYTVSSETIARHHTAALIYTVPFVVYGIFRYLFLLHGGGGGQDTARDMMRDKHLLATGLLWVVATGGIIVWAR